MIARSTTSTIELIHRIKIKRVDDAKFEVIFRIHEASRRADLNALLEATNKDPFECAIRPRQGELFEGGTRVDMSQTVETAAPAVFTCDQCEQDVPLDASGTQHIHADGHETSCTHPSATAVAAVRSGRRGTLASKQQMTTV
jgi:hypothetical protein